MHDNALILQTGRICCHITKLEFIVINVAYLLLAEISKYKLPDWLKQVRINSGILDFLLVHFAEPLMFPKF